MSVIFFLQFIFISVSIKYHYDPEMMSLSMDIQGFKEKCRAYDDNRNASFAFLYWRYGS